MKKISTIRLDDAIKKEMDKHKIHYRETYEDMIRRIILKENKESFGEKIVEESLDMLNEKKNGEKRKNEE